MTSYTTDSTLSNDRVPTPLFPITRRQQAEAWNEPPLIARQGIAGPPPGLSDRIPDGLTDLEQRVYSTYLYFALNPDIIQPTARYMRDVLIGTHASRLQRAEQELARRGLIEVARWRKLGRIIVWGPPVGEGEPSHVPSHLSHVPSHVPSHVRGPIYSFVNNQIDGAPFSSAPPNQLFEAFEEAESCARVTAQRTHGALAIKQEKTIPARVAGGDDGSWDRSDRIRAALAETAGPEREAPSNRLRMQMQARAKHNRRIRPENEALVQNVVQRYAVFHEKIKGLAPHVVHGRDRKLMESLLTQNDPAVVLAAVEFFIPRWDPDEWYVKAHGFGIPAFYTKYNAILSLYGAMPEFRATVQLQHADLIARGLISADSEVDA